MKKLQNMLEEYKNKKNLYRTNYGVVMLESKFYGL